MFLLVQQGRQALALLEQLVQQDRLVNKVQLALILRFPVLRVARVRKEIMDLQGQLDPMEVLDLPELLLRVRPDQPERRVQMVLLARPVELARLALLGQLDLRELVALLDQQVRQAQQVQLDGPGLLLLVRQAQQVRQARRAGQVLLDRQLLAR